MEYKDEFVQDKSQRQLRDVGAAGLEPDGRGEMRVIKDLWLFVVDHPDNPSGEESIVCQRALDERGNPGPNIIPFFATDAKRLKDLKRAAPQLAKDLNAEIRLKKFVGEPVLIEVFKPSEKGTT